MMVAVDGTNKQCSLHRVVKRNPYLAAIISKGDQEHDNIQ